MGRCTSVSPSEVVFTQNLKKRNGESGGEPRGISEAREEK